MHFTFVPSFLSFFNRFGYLPSQVRYKYLSFTDSNLFRVLLALFVRHGRSGAPFRYFFRVLLTSIWIQGGVKRTSLYARSPAVLGVFFVEKVVNVFRRLRFVFFFFFYKLNKLIYKYSNYRRPRYSLEFRYTPPYRRFKELLKYMRKSLVYYRGRTFRTRLGKLVWDLMWRADELQFVRFTVSLQAYLFKTRKHLLTYR